MEYFINEWQSSGYSEYQMEAVSTLYNEFVLNNYKDNRLLIHNRPNNVWIAEEKEMLFSVNEEDFCMSVIVYLDFESMKHYYCLHMNDFIITQCTNISFQDILLGLLKSKKEWLSINNLKIKNSILLKHLMDFKKNSLVKKEVMLLRR